MDLRQKIKDVILLLKEERKYQFLLGAVIILFLWGALSDNRPSTRRGRKKDHVVAAPKGNIGDGKYEAYNDLVKRFSTDLKDIKTGQVELGEKIKKNESRVVENEERTAEILKKVIERLADIERTPATSMASYNGAQDGGEGGFPTDSVAIPDDALESFGAPEEQEVIPPPPPKEDGRRAIIGIGDSVRVKLMAGANAPTDGTPYPVLFRLVGAVQGPDGSSLPLGEARLLAAAQGSLSDRRALFRLTSLNMRYPDGSRGVYPVDGWIVGEDGIRGMEGILIDPIGKSLAGKFMAGMVGGMGDGIARSRTNTIVTNDSVYETIDGSTLEWAAGRGMSKAANAWEQYINKRTELLTPHVKVLSGREATAVFSRNLPIDGLYELLEEEDMVFASLD